MNSLPFSIGNYNPTNHLRNVLGSHARKHPIIVESKLFNETKKSSAFLTRREAVGLGFCFSFLQLINPRPDTAAAEGGGAAPPCDYTEAPSGLAYCDKVVGYGPEAVKGQLIKVTFFILSHFALN